MVRLVDWSEKNKEYWLIIVDMGWGSDKEE